MIGANSLRLNQRTARQAFQEWLDRRWKDPVPRVVAVAADGDDFVIDVISESESDEILTIEP